MLCIFGRRQSAEVVATISLSTSATKKAGSTKIDDSSEDDEEIERQLEALSASLPTRMRAYVAEHIFGSGVSGMAYVRLPSTAYLQEDGVHICFSGEIAGERTMDVAKTIVDVYKELLAEKGAGADISERNLAASSLAKLSVCHVYASHPAMPILPSLQLGFPANRCAWDIALRRQCLHERRCNCVGLQGHFAYVLYDKPAGRVVAFRDPGGGKGLFWGTALLSGKLMFSTDRGLVEDECVDVDAFPAGVFFVSTLRASSTSSDLTPAEDLSLSDVRQDAMCCGSSTDRDVFSSLQKVPSNSAISIK
mmetsp:Transcript_30754/g.86916  ORF Transcript_30754/g.86916 Transcript_30754/m.86916 type:complete len:307 (-) Transcript_30754:240-1160(-)